ncbi:unnamed protein product, partial [Allacma fusca]
EAIEAIKAYTTKMCNLQPRSYEFGKHSIRMLVKF